MPTSMRSHNEPGRRDLSRRPVTHRSEFPPAIPRRVAPQQSPLPLRRLLAYTSLHEADASPCQPTANLSPNFRVSLTGCSPLGCSRVRETGLRDNRRTVSLSTIESLVIEGVEKHLGAPDLIAEYVREYRLAWEVLHDRERKRRADLER